MKSAYLLTAALLVSTLTTTVADDQAEKKKKANHNPAGTWVWESEVGGTFLDNKLTIYWRNKELTGEFSNDVADLEIENGKFDGETFSFTLEFDAEGTEVLVEFSGVADGDKMTGTSKVDLGGEELDLPVAADRKTGKRDVLGDWNMTIELDSGEAFEPVVTLKLEKGKLAGTYADDIAGTHELKDVSLKNNVLTFSIGGEAEGDGTPFSAKFTGKPRGDRIRGKAEVEIAGTELAAKIRGKRIVEDEEE